MVLGREAPCGLKRVGTELVPGGRKGRALGDAIQVGRALRESGSEGVPGGPSRS